MATSNAMSKYRQIGFLMEAGQDINPNDYLSNKDKIDDLLRRGVIYRDKKKKYWVDLQERDCFAIYARGLNITNSDRRVYWQWTTESEGIEVAEVVRTRWLEVRGSFWTMNLSPNVRYKVTFRTKMAKPSGMVMPVYADPLWGLRMRQVDTRVSTMKGQTVNLRLTLPDGSNQERQEVLPGAKLGDDPWHELEVGQFDMNAQNVGRMEFSMEQLFGRWRTGLIIKCVEIKAV